jgi:hypothetical protein
VGVLWRRLGVGDGAVCQGKEGNEMNAERLWILRDI